MKIKCISQDLGKRLKIGYIYDVIKYSHNMYYVEVETSYYGWYYSDSFEVVQPLTRYQYKLFLPNVIDTEFILDETHDDEYVENMLTNFRGVLANNFKYVPRDFSFKVLFKNGDVATAYNMGVI